MKQETLLEFDENHFPKEILQKSMFAYLTFLLDLYTAAHRLVSARRQKRDGPTNRPTNRSTNQPSDLPTNQPTDLPRDGHTLM